MRRLGKRVDEPAKRQPAPFSEAQRYTCPIHGTVLDVDEQGFHCEACIQAEAEALERAARARDVITRRREQRGRR